MEACNVVLNGEHYNGYIDDALFTIAVDGGYNMLQREVDVFIGDGDSVTSKSILARESIALQPEKDMTDGEFSIDYAIERGYDMIYLYGVDGGRLDHVLTNLNLFARAYDKGVTVVGKCNNYDIYFTRGDEIVSFDDVKGCTISIVPFDRAVHIMSMKGLYYTVTDFTIPHTSSRGMSNVASKEHVEIDFGEGSALVFVLKD